jgi:hypothetical protein
VLVVVHRVVEADDAASVDAWLSRVRDLAAEVGARIDGIAGSVVAMTVENADARGLRERLLAHVHEGESVGIRATYALTRVEHGDAREALRRAELLACSTTLPGVRLGPSLPLSSIVPALNSSLFPSISTAELDGPEREPVASSPFMQALAAEDWALAQEYVDAALERSSDPRAFERLTAIVELARGHSRIAARLLRRSVGDRTPTDSRGALALALAELCEGDFEHALRDGTLALAHARACGQTVAERASEAFLRLAIARTRTSVAASPQGAPR